MNLRLGFSIFLLFIWSISVSLAIAGTFSDDFLGNELSDEWFVTKKRATGDEISVANGVLTFDAKGSDVVIGIRYGAIDLTQGEFMLECDYLAGYQHTYISFNSEPSDTEAWDNPPMFIFIIVKGVYQFVGAGGPSVDNAFNFSVGQDEWHHYRVELSPPRGKKVSFKTTIDNNKFEADGNIDIGGMDPTNIYVYFEVWTPSGNPTLLDNVSLTSPSISGNVAVNKINKLPITWGRLKNL